METSDIDMDMRVLDEGDVQKETSKVQKHAVLETNLEEHLVLRFEVG